jgi:hypothetical protein
MDEKTAMRRFNAILKKVIKIVGKDKTSTAQLAGAGRNILGNQFRGVFPVDRLEPSTLTHKHPYCIINLDESYKRGSHWCAVVLRSDESKNKSYIIYDSFGRSHTNIVPSLRYFDLTSTDSDAEQRESENSCGAFSLAWITFVSMYGEDAGLLI